jgi:hypothetical protein
MDVHRSMAVIAVVEGNRLSRGGRIDLIRDAVIKFGRKLRSDDEVVIEATARSPTQDQWRLASAMTLERALSARRR